MNKDDSLKLLEIFSALYKNVDAIADILEKYEYPELHASLSKIFFYMGIFSGDMAELTLHGND